MKKIAFVLWLCLSWTGLAQSPEEAIRRNPSKTAGSYYVYDSGALPAPTPAPKGYKPFYVSHFGRHGARYCTGEYDKMYGWLDQAEKAGVLTGGGKAFFDQYRTFYQKVRLSRGNLTRLGMEQHRSIARHLYERFPEVFEGPTHVVAASTESPRVIMSMWSCLSELQKSDPDLSIDADASARFASWLQPVLPSNPYYVKERMQPGQAAQDSLKAYFDRTVPWERILLRLFTGTEAVTEVLKTTPQAFVVQLHAIVEGTLCLDEDRGCFDSWMTGEERYKVWKYSSASMFAGCGRFDNSGDLKVDYAAFTLEQILQTADADMASGDTQLRLRFGHDASLMPLVTFLNPNGMGRNTSSFEESLDIFPNYLMPMGSSLQFIFYRNARNRVLVKVLLNEEEVTLPFREAAGHCYSWEDFKAYYQERIAASKDKVLAPTGEDA